jgi:hypothetical protein
VRGLQREAGQPGPSNPKVPRMADSATFIPITCIAQHGWRVAGAVEEPRQ